jgi:sulfite exporter TauE/SafE
MQQIRTQSTALFGIGVALSGVVLAVRADVRSLAVLFGILAVILAVGLRPESKRRTVGLRPDLARWLEQVSAVAAEPMEDVLDRSVSAYRASVRRSVDE